ncbi:hypothetical protein BC832DRAFT_595570 [Gaertneriomyces semiglobifer]|nr:hypothetical protein BC832DRAFT_595570 [Gaertneriomyces semiglobifer]
MRVLPVKVPPYKRPSSTTTPASPAAKKVKVKPVNMAEDTSSIFSFSTSMDFSPSASPSLTSTSASASPVVAGRSSPLRTPANTMTAKIPVPMNVAQNIIGRANLSPEDRDAGLRFSQTSLGEQLLELKCSLLRIETMCKDNTKMVLKNFVVPATAVKNIRAAARKLCHNPMAKRYIDVTEGLSLLAFRRQWGGLNKKLQGNAEVLQKVRAEASGALAKAKNQMKSVLLTGGKAKKATNDLELEAFAGILFCTRNPTNEHFQRAAFLRAVVHGMIADDDQQSLGKDFWGIIDASVVGLFDDYPDVSELQSYLQGIVIADRAAFTRPPSRKEVPKEDTHEHDMQLDEASTDLVFGRAKGKEPIVDLTEEEVAEETEVPEEAEEQESEETVGTGEEELEAEGDDEGGDSDESEVDMEP